MNQKRPPHKDTASILFLVLLFGIYPPLGKSTETSTDARQAGNLYRLQGEYRGVIDAWGGNWGAQVVATGKQSLRVQLLKGGLPGDGFDGTEPDRKVEYTLKEDEKECTASGDSFVIVLKPGSLEVRGKEKDKDTRLGVLTKIVRESNTLGQKPPPQAIILFGPRDNNFVGATVLDDGLGVGGTSRALMEDHRLHIEFCIPFQPADAGQSRGNSGVYIQGRYEVQILDSFGLKGADNECGGIYQLAKPRINMCYPPLTWQTYDIDFVQAKYDGSGIKTKNAKIRVEHNGVLIHDSLELKNHTPGKLDESPSPGPLYLQDHGNSVIFRNVWFVPAVRSP
jgi:Domain of Unknown Function (DUF1080)